MKKHIYTIANFGASIALALILDIGGIDVINKPWVFLAILACLYLLIWSSYREGIEKGVSKTIQKPWLFVAQSDVLRNKTEGSPIEGGKWNRGGILKPGTRKSRFDTGCLDETAADACDVPAFLRKRKG